MCSGYWLKYIKLFIAVHGSLFAHFLSAKGQQICWNSELFWKFPLGFEKILEVQAMYWGFGLSKWPYNGCLFVKFWNTQFWKPSDFWNFFLEIQKTNYKNLGLEISETSSVLEVAQRVDGLWLQSSLDIIPSRVQKAPLWQLFVMTSWGNFTY